MVVFPNKELPGVVVPRKEGALPNNDGLSWLVFVFSDWFLFCYLFYSVGGVGFENNPPDWEDELRFPNRPPAGNWFFCYGVWDFPKFMIIYNITFVTK